jgi:hypothetical protein
MSRTKRSVIILRGALSVRPAARQQQHWQQNEASKQASNQRPIEGLQAERKQKKAERMQKANKGNLDICQASGFGFGRCNGSSHVVK